MIRPIKAITSLPTENLLSSLQSDLGNVSQADVLRFYATSQTVYSIVNTRAENVAMPLMRVVDENGKPLPDHPLSPIFSKRSNYQDVMKRIEFSMSLTGHSLVVPNPNLIGRFDGAHNLIALSPRLYRRDGDSYRGLKGFYITPNAFVRERYLTPDDALYMWGISPFDEFDGTSPAEVAANAAGVQKEMMDTQWSYFQNRMIDGQFLQPAATTAPNARAITEQIAKALQTALARFGIGAKNAGRTTVVQDRWEAINLQADFAELAMKELGEDANNSICKAFQFPAEMLTFNASNYAQSREAVRFWRDNWLKPRVRWYAQQFSNFFTQWYGRPIYIEPDFSGLDEEDDIAKIDRAQKRTQAMFTDLHTAALDAGVKQPDDLLKGMYLVNGVPVPIAEFRNYWMYARLVAPSVFNSELMTGVPLPQPNDPNKVIPTATGGEPIADAQTQAEAAGQTSDAAPVASIDPTKALGEPLFVGLSLANDPNVAGLQRRLMSKYTDPAIKWNPPDDYHVTVLYAEAVDPALAAQFCEALREIDVPALALRVGQLNTFDNLDERALHFRIGRNADLLNYQAAVYEIAQDQGIICSPHSEPTQYKPHITMGYMPDKTPRIPFDSKIKVTPQGIRCDHGGKNLWQSWDEESPEDPTPDDTTTRAEDTPEGKVKPIKNVPAAVYREIVTAVNKAFKGQSFVPALLPEYTVTHIRALKGYGFTTPEVIEAAKWHYLGVTAAKALTDTRSRFGHALVDLFQKDIKKSVFISRMDILLERYCRQAMVDGFADGGVEDVNLDDGTDEDMIAALNWLNNHINDQKQYVRNVAEVLFSDESLSDEEIQSNKPDLWWNKSVMPAYNYGMHQASGDNALGIFQLGAAEKHCVDCPKLDGIAVTFKKWDKYFGGELPPCKATACGGWKCQCRVKPYRGKKYRGTLPVLHGKAA